MTQLTTCKITLIFFLINFSVQLIAQTNETGIIKGKIYDAKSGTELIGANAFIELNYEYVGTQSDLDGNFEFEIPVGKHLLKISYIGYEDITKEVTVKLNDTLKYELSISPIDTSCAWQSSVPYAELQGFWKPDYYFNGNRRINQTKRKDRAGAYFYFSNDSLPGKLSWNDGCNNCGYLYFRHTGNGIIELQKKGLLQCTLMWCDFNKQFGAFISSMRGNKTNSSISDNGQLLTLSQGNEKFVLHKIHDNNSPDFSTELFGTWIPVEGKLKRKKIKKFADVAEVVFDWRKDVNAQMGAVQYKDGGICGSGNMNLTYRYLDKDFIYLLYYRGGIRSDKICNTKFLLGALFGSFSKNGCNLKFNETKDVVTLQYGKNYLVLKRKG